MQSSGEQQGAQRVTLLHPTAGFHDPLLELQSGGLPVTPSCPAAQTRKVGVHGGQHGFTTNSVERIAEVQLKGNFLGGTVLPVIPGPGGVYGCFNAARYCNSKLGRLQVGASFITDQGH